MAIVSSVKHAHTFTWCNTNLGSISRCIRQNIQNKHKRNAKQQLFTAVDDVLQGYPLEWQHSNGKCHKLSMFCFTWVCFQAFTETVHRIISGVRNILWKLNYPTFELFCVIFSIESGIFGSSFSKLNSSLLSMG